MKPYLIRFLLISLTVAALGLPSASAQSTTRVSVDSLGLQGNFTSNAPSISADGQYVAFESYATNLVPGDTNGTADIFVHDRQTGQTTRVSVNSLGVQGNSASGRASLSADGHYVAFHSSATNLVPGDTNGVFDIFFHDRQTGQTTRVSVDSFGGEGNSGSSRPSISADGRYVAYYSSATNLVPNDTNNQADVFIHDRRTGQTTRLSVDSLGVQGNDASYHPSISADGQYVTFESKATNLVLGDTNGFMDVFVHDRQMGQTTRVSVDSLGGEGNEYSSESAISADGRDIAFQSGANNLVPGDTNGTPDVFVHVRQTGQTTRVSVDSLGVEGNGGSSSPSISADGRFVAFGSYATNIVSGDSNANSDIFVHDRQTGRTTRVSVNSIGVQGNHESYLPSVTAAGRYVAFFSLATNLVPGDTNGDFDVFVHDRGQPTLHLAVSGTCPGQISLTISGATASGLIGILYGSAGTFTKSGTPCAGLTLGLASPTLGALIPADGAGHASLAFPAPLGACGRSIQGVDLTSCSATNLVVL